MVIVISVLLTVICYVIPVEIYEKYAKFLPVITAFFNLIAVFFMISGLKKSISKPVSIIQANAFNMTENLSAKMQTMPHAPEEIEEINNSLRRIAGNVEGSIITFKENLKINEIDFGYIEKLYAITVTDSGPGEKIHMIISNLMECCEYSEFFYYLKSHDRNTLEMTDHGQLYIEEIQTISLKDPGFMRFISVFNQGRFEILDGIKNDESLDKDFRMWAKKHLLHQMHLVPILANKIPNGLLIFMKKNDNSLSRGQRILINLSSTFIGGFHYLEKQVISASSQSEEERREKDILSVLTRVDDFEQMCIDFFNTLSKHVEMDWAGISVYDETESNYMLYSLDIWDSPQKIKKSVIPISGSGTTWVWENRKSWLEGDITNENRFTENVIYAQSNLRSGIITPLYSYKRFAGSLSVASKRINHYNRTQVKVLEDISRLLGNAVENSMIITKSENSINELKEENRKYEDFYRNFSHELKNPLKVLNQMIITARNKSKYISPDQIKKSFDKIEISMKTLEKNIEDIIDYSRAESGRMDYSPESFFMVEVLKAALWEYQYTAREKQVSLKLSIPREMTEVHGDKEKLLVVCKELVGNSLKNTDAGGTINLKVSVIQKNLLRDRISEFYPPEVAKFVDRDVDHILINVSDTGKGIPFEKQKSIFLSPLDAPEKFGDRQAGFGYGLPRVKQIVDLHQGVIWVKSRENSGSKFFISLPQYGKDWGILRKTLRDGLEKAKQTLTSLTIIIISFKECEKIKEQLKKETYQILFREMEKRTRSTLRNPQDEVHPYPDKDILVVVSQSDIEEVEVIKRRIKDRIGILKFGEIEKPPRISIKSVTYPDEVLTIDQLIIAMNSAVSGSAGFKSTNYLNL